MNTLLKEYQQELNQELAAILHYWQTHALDTVNGGFWER